MHSVGADRRGEILLTADDGDRLSGEGRRVVAGQGWGLRLRGKIKTGVGAAELSPPPPHHRRHPIPPSLGVLLHIHNEKGRRGGLVFAPRHTLD